MASAACVIGLAGTPALANLSCETAGWIEAVVLNSGTPDRTAGSAREITLTALLESRNQTSLKAEIRRVLGAGDAARVSDFLDRLNRLPQSGSMAAGLRDPSFTMARSDVRDILRSLRCAAGPGAQRAGGDLQGTSAANADAGAILPPNRSMDGAVQALPSYLVPIAVAGGIFAMVVGTGIFVMRRAIHKQRSQHRFPCDIPSGLDAGAEPCPGQVKNLSLGGCKLATSAALRPGTRLALSFASLSVDAVVIWNKDGEAGVKFEEEISEAQLERALGHAQDQRQETGGRRLAGLSA